MKSDALQDDERKLLVEIAATNQSWAERIRKLPGSPLEKSLRTVVKLLADNGIPSLTIGGYAVQQHGYPRFTDDLDIVAPDWKTAVTLLLESGHCQSEKFKQTVVEPGAGIEIGVLQTGQCMGGAEVPTPAAGEVSTEPRMCSLKDLLNLKPSSSEQDPFSGHRTGPMPLNSSSAITFPAISCKSVPCGSKTCTCGGGYKRQ
jgi:hypothetical protein